MSGFSLWQDISTAWDPKMRAQIGLADYMEECAREGQKPDNGVLREYESDLRKAGR